MLVGGGAGTGKSTAARLVAQQLEASWLQLDTLWIALRDAAPEGSPQRDLLDVDAHLRRAVDPTDDLVARHAAASGAVCAALPAALAFELEAHPTVVADGAWILPAWAARLSFPGVEVSSVFLHEPDPDRLRTALGSRREGPSLDWHATSNRLAAAYGDRLAEQAAGLGLPVLESRPRASLVDRLLAAIAG